MRLQIRHETTYRYDPPAAGLGLALRLFPSAAPSQAVVSWTVQAGGQEVAPLLVNGFGDKEALWLAGTPAKDLTIAAEGVVETTETGGVLGRYGRARPGVFLRCTERTEPDDAIRDFAAGVTGVDALSWLHALNAAAGAAIAYRPGATHAAATAAEALALGAGVCQDQAHLFLSAARLRGHPARYVVGYLHDAETAHAETHAWAEAHVEGLGWVGFDPTHGRSPTADYVRLCAGLDAADAAPIRGTWRGAAEESLAATVRVAQVEAGQQQQQ